MNFIIIFTIGKLILIFNWMYHLEVILKFKSNHQFSNLSNIFSEALFHQYFQIFQFH
jgi:hypothetical protein